MDIDTTNIITDTDFSVSITANPSKAVGNKLLSNIFEITLMTDINGSLFSYGYGANGTDLMITGFTENSNDDTVASMVKVACDNAVFMMKADQSNIPGIPKTERISSAYVDSVNKKGEKVSVTIRIVPEEFDNSSGALLLTLPF